MPDWAPTPDDVAVLLRSKTQGTATIAAPNGEEMGRFTDSTRPTLEEVRRLIALACSEVGALFAGRTPCTADLESAAGVAAAYKVCQQIEAGSDARSSEGRAFEEFQKLYDASSKAAAGAIVASCPLDSGASQDGGPLAPAGRGHNRVLIGPSQVAW